MTNRESLTKQQAESILHILDDTIGEDLWKQSTFLVAVAKNLQDVRARFAALTERAYSQCTNGSELTHQAMLKSGMKEVFISLYSLDASLSTWEKILINLPKQNISRPIYSTEEAVLAMVRAKEKKVNEAYISIFVHEDDIIRMDSTKVITDKLGNELLTVKNNAISIDNYHYFVHLNSVYQFKNEKLILET